jgi:transposase
MERPRRRFFPEEFKREAVAQIEASGRSAGAIATDLGLCDTVLRKWIRQFGSGPRAPLAVVGSTAASVRRP